MAAACRLIAPQWRKLCRGNPAPLPTAPARQEGATVPPRVRRRPGRGDHGQRDLGALGGPDRLAAGGARPRRAQADDGPRGVEAVLLHDDAAHLSGHKIQIVRQRPVRSDDGGLPESGARRRARASVARAARLADGGRGSATSDGRFSSFRGASWVRLPRGTGKGSVRCLSAPGLLTICGCRALPQLNEGFGSAAKFTVSTLTNLCTTTTQDLAPPAPCSALP